MACKAKAGFLLIVTLLLLQGCNAALESAEVLAKASLPVMSPQQIFLCEDIAY